MNRANSTSAPPAAGSRSLLWLLLILGAILLALYHLSFKPGEALFSNDGPLAAQNAAFFHLPGAFFGIWNDLYWIGSEAGSFIPNITGLVLLALGPYGYCNFHAPIALLILGLCSWLFFRQLGFRPGVCVLGALAAALNMNIVSNVGWGLSSRALCLAMTFLALAAVEGSFRGRPLLKTILAGLAIGMSISEGGDNGAIFSLFVAAFALVGALLREGPAGLKTGKAVGRIALMAVCAAILAAQTLNLFVSTTVKGGIEAQQEQMSEAQRWDWATQWSLPKIETLRVIIPGLYGYRMDTPEGGQYWGSVGQSPGWTPGSGLLARYSGAGEYAGVLIVLVALWALAQACRRTGSAFTEREQKLIWFWAVAALAALLLAWGRHAPFYRLVYALPYFSTIRNPIKFMHPFHFCLMVLFAYGLQGLSRLYLEKTASTTRSLFAQMKTSWAAASGFEKRWTLGSAAAAALGVLSLLVYSSAGGDLIRHLTRVGFGAADAELIAQSSIREMSFFTLLLLISTALVLAIQSGWFAGPRTLWAWIILGSVFSLDLVRADAPWINYYNYQERYASNPVVDILRDKPYEQRVFMPRFEAGPQLTQLQQFYHVEWLQHHFLYYNVQSLDVAQEPRLPADKAAYLRAVGGNLARYWQLTNTRFLFGMAGPFVDAMNQQLTPGHSPFQLQATFNLFQQPDSAYIGAATNANGPFALIEFKNALPRAKLYSHWEVNTNDQVTLDRLANAAFDPAQSVLVSNPIPAPAPASTNSTAGSVEFVDYSPRVIRLRTKTAQPSVLLLNDRFHPSWRVTVDGRSHDLLRCNYIMRGVYLAPGEHTVLFRYAPPVLTFYITLASVLVGLALCGFITWEGRKPQNTPRETVA